MILVCGVLADAMVELMCARLEDLGYGYLLLDQAGVPGRADVSWELDGGHVRGAITSGGRAIDLADLTGVYARYVAYRGGPERADLSEPERVAARAEYQLALMSLFDVLPCVVVNRARCSTSNDSKVYQAFVAAAHGFEVPRTLVTTDPGAARDFYAACRRRVVYKSLSSVRSVVRRLRDEDLGGRLERLPNCPTQFQEWVDGVDVRVHTVGAEVFATELVSEATDYRYARREGASLTAREVELPAPVAAACVAMARSLGLAVSGVDLRRTADGRYYCFEVNPSPGFIFYEQATGQPISRAVADLLRRG